MIRIGWIVSLALIATTAMAAEPPEQAVVIPTRPGVSVAAYLTEPDTPARAALIIFAGGDGNVGVRPGEAVPPPQPEQRGNFLVRSRRLLAGHGLVVLTPDAPSDLNGSIPDSFRLSDEHVADIAALTVWLKHRSGGLPVWLVGTSRGSYSAAIGAERLGRGIDGVILTSSVTKESPRQAMPYNGVLSLDLNKVAVPALVMAHHGDSCWASPPADAQRLAEALTGTPRREVVVLDGGTAPRSASCEAMAHHGYIGQEDEAAAVIARFVLDDASSLRP